MHAIISTVGNYTVVFHVRASELVHALKMRFDLPVRAAECRALNAALHALRTESVHTGTLRDFSIERTIEANRGCVDVSTHIEHSASYTHAKLVCGDVFTTAVHPVKGIVVFDHRIIHMIAGIHEMRIDEGATYARVNGIDLLAFNGTSIDTLDQSKLDTVRQFMDTRPVGVSTTWATHVPWKWRAHMDALIATDLYMQQRMHASTWGAYVAHYATELRVQLSQHGRPMLLTDALAAIQLPCRLV